MKFTMVLAGAKNIWTVTSFKNFLPIGQETNCRLRLRPLGGSMGALLLIQHASSGSRGNRVASTNRPIPAEE